jgi:putative DNA primase/helicase
VNNQLIAKNADLPFPNAESTALVAKIIEREAESYFLYAARLGWRPARRAFVLANGQPVGSEENIFLLPPTWLNESHSVSLSRSGTADGWKAEVAGRAKYSRAAMLAISAAFAAPLLEATSLQSFGINIYGRAKVGKTAALLAASSVAGIGRENQLPNWASTANAQSELARLFSDTLLPANEVGLLKGRKRDAYGPIRELTYRLSEGKDKARHSSWKYAGAGPYAQFRTIFVSTAEHSFDEYAAYAGEKRDEGEYARCIDVKAAQDGRRTIMTSRPSGMKKKDFKKWARQSVIELRHACEAQHGTVLEPYLAYLIAQGADLNAQVAEYQAEFMKEVRGKGVEGAVEHAARNVSLVYAGGRMGIESGLLPWTEKALLKAVVTSFQLSLGDIHYHQRAEERAVAALKKGIAGARIQKRKMASTFSSSACDGYRALVNGVKIYTVHAKVFRSWFSDRRQVRLALEWLERKHLLKPKTTDKTLDRKSTDWAEQTPKWPDGKSVRCIVFAEPKKQP